MNYQNIIINSLHLEAWRGNCWFVFRKLSVRVKFRKRRNSLCRRRCVGPPITITPSDVELEALSMEPLVSANGMNVGYYLERLRNITSLSQLHHPGMITQFNPHYQFNDGARRNAEICVVPPTTWKLDDLGELSRDQLVLIRWIKLCYHGDNITMMKWKLK